MYKEACNVVEKDGHLWHLENGNGRCVRCGRRYDHYLGSEKSIKEWESEAPLETLATLICESILIPVYRCGYVPNNSDYIAPVGWGTYIRRQHVPKHIIDYIPEPIYDIVRYGSRPEIREYHNDFLLEVNHEQEIKNNPERTP